MSELGNLSQCMVDSDAAAKMRARRLRRKALAVSIAFEAAVIGGLVLWPLLTLGVLPSQAVVTPMPPYRGVPEQRPVLPHPPHVIHNPAPNIPPPFQPPTIPRRIDTGPDPEPPSVGPGIEPIGPGIPGGFEDGQRTIEIARPPRLQPPNRPVVRDAVVMEAMLVHRVLPEYPAPAKWIHLAGTVVLRATIGTDGTVRNLITVSGNPILTQAAREAVLQWRYRPTMLNGQAVEVETEITVNFVLN